ncbi:methyltransferase [Thermomonospora umbrina]|uniref:O-methyltransferase n=1 Tax=Thermomonospora umbrina TaxID=111806 RepID=A0A3D9T9H3_9ACTN|nr:methyltransferase [Thermomonospora umbrina]REF00412.1 O-methyltransferase [Thermomonospora umbrina]
MNTTPNQPTPPADLPLTKELISRALVYLDSAALGVAARLGVADHLSGQPRTATELAALVEVDAAFLQRVLQLLTSRGIFREDWQQRFHLTPLARLLVSDAPHSLRDAVTMLTADYFWRPAGRMADAVGKGHSVFAEIFDAPFFDHLTEHPTIGAGFHLGMANYSRSTDQIVADTFPFPETGTVVDVGGGHGGLLRAVLAGNPGLTGILYDQDEVLRDHVLDRPETTGRWRTVSGDFFASAPEGADIYLLKHIVHDWSDDKAELILRSCRRAMPDHARVLVVDAVVPPPNVTHYGRTLDLLMMSVFNGRERSEEEFDALFRKAGLKLARVLPTAGFEELSIIEAVAL